MSERKTEVSLKVISHDYVSAAAEDAPETALMLIYNEEAADWEGVSLYVSRSGSGKAGVIYASNLEDMENILQAALDCVERATKKVEAHYECEDSLED